MPQPIVTFRDLEVWQDARDLVTRCYRHTGAFPQSERHGGLTSQIRRAAVSMPANIADGHARPTNVYRNHIRIALGSQAELDTLLDVGARLSYVAGCDLQPIVEHLARVGRRLHALKSSLGSDPEK